MLKIGTKHSPAQENMLDFKGNKIDYIEILGKDEEIKGNFKVLVYPATGFCSVDSLSESDIKNKFKKV